MSDSVVQRSESIGALVGALAKAQLKLANPERNRTVTVKTKTGGSYDFAYATLDAILDHARPILAENEIALLQGVRSAERHILVSTMLAHSSGEWIESSVQFGAAVGAQETGSLITYGRRYTLCGLLGVAAEEDDDANSADGNTVAKSEPTVSRDPIPADIPAWEGKIVNLKARSGKGPYKVVGADGEEFNTFSDSVIDYIKKAEKGSFFQITYKQTKFGRDLEEIRVVDDEPPFGLD